MICSCLGTWCRMPMYLGTMHDPFRGRIGRRWSCWSWPAEARPSARHLARSATPSHRLRCRRREPAGGRAVGGQHDPAGRALRDAAITSPASRCRDTRPRACCSAARWPRRSAGCRRGSARVDSASGFSTAIARSVRRWRWWIGPGARGGASWWTAGTSRAGAGTTSGSRSTSRWWIW